MYFSAMITPKTSIFLILMCSITNINAKRDRTRRGAADPAPFPVGNGHLPVACPLGMIVPRTASPDKRIGPDQGGASPPSGAMCKFISEFFYNSRSWQSLIHFSSERQ